jgi:hypothetical protein
MPTLSCRFCGHRNPDRSKFCNECGSQLDLAPCDHCGSINHVTADTCHQCGAAIAVAAQAEASAEPEESLLPSGDGAPLAAGAEGPTDAAGFGHAGSIDPGPRASVPTALAERLDTFAAMHVDEDARAIAVHAGERSADMPSPVRRRHGRSRIYGVALGIAIAGVTGALAWVWWNPLQASMPGWLAGLMAPREASAPVNDVRSPAPVEPAAGADAAPSSASPANVAPQPATAPPSAPPADAAPGVATAPSERTHGAEALASLEPISPAPPLPALEEMHALDALPSLVPVELAVAPFVPGSSGRAAAARSAQAARSRAQAERDALATRRLIARDLAGFPPEYRAPAQ